MRALLKYGKQIMGLASTTRSQQQQQLGFRFARYLTTKSHHLSSGANDMVIPGDNNNNSVEFDMPQEAPLSFKGFLNLVFRKKIYPPPVISAPPTPFKELLGKLTDLLEKSKSCPEEHLPQISPVWNEVLDKISDESYVKLVYEFARREATEADRPILDKKVKDLVDNIPPSIIPFFQDMMFRKIHSKYLNLDGDSIINMRLDPTPRVDFIADVSDIGKEHLKVFVAKDMLMVTGTDKASPPAPVYKAAPKILVKFPIFPYLHTQVTASIIRNQLKVVIPGLNYDSAVVNNPSVYQLNLIPTRVSFCKSSIFV